MLFRVVSCHSLPFFFLTDLSGSTCRTFVHDRSMFSYQVDAPKELLRPIKVGPSSYLKVGQQCLAIGNPFGFDHTLTVGVISGLNRDINSQTGVTIGGGIQTDAAINPGNRSDF